MLEFIDIQFLAEAAEAEGANEAGNVNAVEGDGSPDAGINTEEVDRIAKARSERASRNAATSYFKQKGLTEAEAEEAFKAYKDGKAQQAEAEKNDLLALQQKVQTYEAQESEAIQNANRRLVRAEALVQATGLNVRSDRVDYLIKLADLTGVQIDDTGNADGAAIRFALEDVLEKLPELKNNNAEDDKKPGFKLGAPNQTGGKGLTDQLSAIFGVED